VAGEEGHAIWIYFGKALDNAIMVCLLTCFKGYFLFLAFENVFWCDVKVKIIFIFL
jgi:hypothetical protein